MALKLLGVALVLALGVAGGYLLRPPVEQWLTGRGEVEASVTEERREEDRLVLALRSGDQTMMATFRERMDDVAELVQVGDVVTLRVGGHGVFADDVPIVRVQRPAPPTPSRRRRRSEDTEHEAEEGAAEAREAHVVDAHEGAAPPSGEGEAHEGEAHEGEAHAAEEIAAQSHGHAS
jgi:hypothetical protein